MNRFGYGYLQRGEHTNSAFVFALNTRLYPQSANAFDSWGEALESAGQLRQALAAYQKAVALAAESNDENSTYYLANVKRLQGKVKGN